MLPDTQRPAEIVANALAAERAGFDELWVGEDYFCGGGIASAAALLAASGLPVGLGVAPVGGRHPALLALELATLAGIYPDRLYAGLGAGVPDLSAAIGAQLQAPLTAVRETLHAVRTLIGGGTLNLAGRTFTAEEVTLMHPPASPPPLYIGAAGPRMLRLSGAEADGTVLSVLSGRDYVGWARARLREGGAGPSHRLVAYALCAIDADPDRARDRLRELVAYAALPSPRHTLSEVQGFAEEAEELSRMAWQDAIPRIPDWWLRELVVAGTAAACAAQVVSLFEAGADSVALCFPPGPDCAAMLAEAGSELLPRVRAALGAAPEAVR
jgi:alkanesulfonate monooxygenase SsuD/methylene tetrahydromethanopterin reductase-like flavin-dependent oxidoreductase (luciferase family)